MSSYLIPIEKAIICFPFIALILTLPFLIYQWRKHKYLNKFRAFIFYTFILYLLCAYFLVILPLPLTRDVKSMQREGIQLYQFIPFNFIKVFMNETSVNFSEPHSYIRMFTERAFLQAAFNAILLTPLGVYLRYYFHKSFKSTVIICFFTSVFFELTQITGLYGIYNAPYRIFDVDDLILNTFAGVLGYAITPIFSKLLPNSRRLDDGIEFEEMTIGFIRRFIAFIVDLVVVIVISLPLAIINQTSIVIVVFLYLIVGVYAANGMTLGNYIVCIRLKGKSDKLKFIEVLIRNGILYGGIFGINYLLNEATFILWGSIEGYFMVAFTILINGFIAVSFFMSLVSKDKLFFYERISNTKNVTYVRKNKVDKTIE